MPSTNTFVKDIYCPKCNSRYSIDTVLTLCRCGRVAHHLWWVSPQIFTQRVRGSTG